MGGTTQSACGLQVCGVGGRPTGTISDSATRKSPQNSSDEYPPQIDLTGDSRRCKLRWLRSSLIV